MGRTILFAGLLMTATAAATLAAAQQQGAVQPLQRAQPTSALKGHNGNAPVDVSSDRIEVQDRADRAIFSGNVVAKQDDLTLTTDRLTIAYTNNGNVQIDRLNAAGGVTVRSPSETGRGDFGVYDLNRKIITLIGNVVLQREGSEVRGNRLTIDLDSGRAVVDGGPPGVGQNGGRVQGHFTVPQRATQNRG
ncbi:lipopolysaccharide transport periplasmic protein LptA [Sphingomonas sp. KRR8]|uniref:lipopolysaccharide transport periplasmic protein LptA n=1 Tax=Sphingomonas sp. KRR8 TaxID=2942996 RepID=UPI0020222572|nr:lipopolysaccharide transport periplasmic protein LptA [Sphingomonas sp. KRR8]URD60135.1 lipopolysaccharide transport periplasmic protein LptA [Sphingomonas sp. KRR8]